MHWDTIVIGSGIGGLAAAVALARTGQRVLVVEQHYLPGGWSHSFTLEGHSFSPGVHYVGELEEGRGLRRVLEGLGVARHLRFREIAPDGYDHISIGGQRFDVPAGRERLLERLRDRFPKLKKPLGRYFDSSRALIDELWRVDQLLRFPEVLRLPWRAPSLVRWAMRPLDALFHGCGIDDASARAILSAQCGNHGLAPSEVSAPVHAIMTEHYLEGAYYPCGGGRRIVSAFLKELRAHGGELRMSTRVRKILVDSGRTTGVELDSGEKLTSEYVVSDADAALTYEKLVDGGATWQRRRARSKRPSVSSLSLFAAVEMDLEALGYDAGNYWWYAHGDVDGIYRRMARRLPAAEIEGLFVSISSLKDPNAHRRGCHTLEVFTFVPYEPFARFANGEPGQRSPDYEALKHSLKEKMLRALERSIPGVRSHLVFAELGTPITNDFYCETRSGGCYGIAKTPGQVGPFAFSTRAPIRGLFLCGASTLSHGVAGAAISGVFAARDLLGKSDMSECLADPDGSLRIEPYEGRPALRRQA
jgi:all-trans-retinol 13,14-reductase